MELRFVARQSDYLIFETIDGEQVRAPIDDSLREAIRRVPQVEANQVSPKDVQAAIRAGQSIQEVATALGVTEETIEPFAAPILDELRFVLQSALTTSLAVNGQMQSFESLVLQNYPGVSFSVKKENGSWVVSAGSELVWNFDQKLRVLEPVSPSARELSKSFATLRDMIPAPKPVIEPRVSLVKEPVEEKPAVPETPAASESPAETETETETEQKASVHDLVQELRARRNPEDLKPASAKGRASLPSWDEIVLGTSSLDPDSDQRDS